MNGPRISLRNYTDGYYRALGEFVAEFTEIEAAMQAALWHLTKVSNATARAVFSGLRADDACNKITRIGDVENWNEAKRADWQMISSHLGILRTLRNDILHYGAEWQAENEWIVTNRDYVHREDKVKNTPITVELLAHATSDLRKLSMHLFFFLFGEAIPEEGRLRRTRWLEVLQRAWLYTPPQPEGRQGKIPDTTPRQ